MSLKIYYFSGTGNSFAVSKKLHELLTDKGSIASLSTFKNEKSIDVDTDVLGLVFPVNFMTIPDVVKSFVKKLKFTTNPYIFAVTTCNGAPGHSLFTLNKLLSKKGKILSSGFVIEMPGNALVTESEIEQERLRKSPFKIGEMAQYINDRSTNKIEGDDSLKCRIESFIMGFLGKRIFIASNLFSSKPECNGCGTCEKVCPVKNIKMVDKRPRWGNDCSRCVACFHWCPKKAVVVGKMLTKRDQYHHPEVYVSDMELNRNSSGIEN